MKKLITLSALSLAAFSLHAQITLNQSGYSGWTPGIDSVRDITNNIPVPAANASVDLTGSTYSNLHTYSFISTTNPAFPAATYGYTFTDAVNSSTNNGVWWTSTSHRAIVAGGVTNYGESIQRQALSIGGTTGTPTDSFVVPAQTVTYSNPRVTIKFPATVNSSWTTSYEYTVNTNVTVASYMMNNVPFTRKTYATSKDTVVGYGKMRVKNMAGANSGYMDVLTVRTHIHYVDSLFMAGSPAPATLLTAFGFTQGAVSDVFYNSWYRNGEIVPLLRVFYTSNTYSTVSSAEAHANRLAAAPNAVNNVTGNDMISAIYPNPVLAGNTVTIKVQDAGQDWTYELINSVGQSVMNGHESGNKLQLPIGNQLVSGTYYLQLRSADGKRSVAPVVIRN